MDLDAALYGLGGLPLDALDYSRSNALHENLEKDYTLEMPPHINFDDIDFEYTETEYPLAPNAEASLWIPEVDVPSFQFLSDGIGIIPVATSGTTGDTVFRESAIMPIEPQDQGTARTRPKNTTSADAKVILERAFKVELYPDKQEAATLASKVQMTVRQVQDWFRNKRRRTSPEDLAKLQSEASAESLPLTETSLDAHEHGRYSGAGRLFDIPIQPKSLHRPASPSCDQFVHPRRLNNTKGASSRASSVHSGGSTSSRISKNSASSRRGRRIWQQAPAQSGEAYPYRCTFCWKGFTTKYSWKRHEETVHVLKSAWICQQPQIVDHVFGDRVHCPYCDAWWHLEGQPSGIIKAFVIDQFDAHQAMASRSEDFNANTLIFDLSFETDFRLHLNTHNHWNCAKRTLDDRTFYRKEHIKQHIANSHNVSGTLLTDINLPQFVKYTEAQLAKQDPALKCPFCTTKFPSWAIRTDHVESHFVRGDTILAEAAQEISWEAKKAKISVPTDWNWSVF